MMEFVKISVAALILTAVTALAVNVGHAQTDIGAAVTTVSGWWTDIEVLAIGVLVFVVGRKLLRKV